MPVVRVLITDDEVLVRNRLSRAFQRAGYEVATAATGQEALDVVQANPPAVILLDVMMPGMDGFEVLQQLKRDPTTASIPVVMLVARPACMDGVTAIMGRGELFVSDDIELTVIMSLLPDPTGVVAAVGRLLQSPGTASSGSA